mmetsp:Transcript_34343/g.39691  ORF Transcript_34343/g.39691 Transcript_34343/m.39691 type:complete len:113 (-) Transcript_34343:30-368(-)
MPSTLSTLSPLNAPVVKPSDFPFSPNQNTTKWKPIDMSTISGMHVEKPSGHKKTNSTFVHSDAYEDPMGFTSRRNKYLRNPQTKDSPEADRSRRKPNGKVALAPLSHNHGLE